MPQYVKVGDSYIAFPDGTSPGRMMATLRASPDVMRIAPADVLKQWGTDTDRGVDWRQHLGRVEANPKATEAEREWARQMRQRVAPAGGPVPADSPAPAHGPAPMRKKQITAAATPQTPDLWPDAPTLDARRDAVREARYKAQQPPSRETNARAMAAALGAGDYEGMVRIAKRHADRPEARDYTLLGSPLLGKIGQVLFTDLRNEVQAALATANPETGSAPAGYPALSAPLPHREAVRLHGATRRPTSTADREWLAALRKMPSAERGRVFAAAEELLGPFGGWAPEDAAKVRDAAKRSGAAGQLTFGVTKLATDTLTDPVNLAMQANAVRSVLAGPRVGADAVRMLGFPVGGKAVAYNPSRIAEVARQAASLGVNAGLAGMSAKSAVEQAQGDMPWAALPTAAMALLGGAGALQSARGLRQAASRPMVAVRDWAGIAARRGARNATPGGAPAVGPAPLPAIAPETAPPDMPTTPSQPAPVMNPAESPMPHVGPTRAPVAPAAPAPRPVTPPAPWGVPNPGETVVPVPPAASATPPAPDPPVEAAADDVLRVVAERDGPVTVDEIAAATGAGVPSVLVELLKLRLAGSVMQLPGSRVVAPTHTIGGQPVYHAWDSTTNAPVYRNEAERVVPGVAHRIGPEPEVAAIEPTESAFGLLDQIATIDGAVDMDTLRGVDGRDDAAIVADMQALVSAGFVFGFPGRHWAVPSHTIGDRPVYVSGYSDRTGRPVYRDGSGQVVKESKRQPAVTMEYGPDGAETGQAAPAALTEPQQAVLTALSEAGAPVHVDQLSHGLGRAPFEMVVDLYALEASHRVLQLPGGRYALVTHRIGNTPVYATAGPDGSVEYRSGADRVVTATSASPAIAVGQSADAAAGGDTPPPPPATQPVDAVLGALRAAAGPMSMEEIKAATGLDDWAVSGAIGVLRDAGDIERTQGDQGEYRFGLRGEAGDKTGGGGSGDSQPSAPRIVLGRKDVTFTPNNRRVDVQYAVVALDDLITSHTDEFAETPGYDQGLQDRDRTKAGTQQQVASLAGRLTPERLNASPDSASGAPIIGDDMQVESGNARTMAMRLARRGYPTQWRDYQRWLGENATAFGIDGPLPPDAVLVRVRRAVDGQSGLSTAARRQFAADAGQSTVQARSDQELAVAEGRALMRSGTMGLWAGADVLSAGNREFVAAWLRLLPPSELNAVVDAGGALSKAGAQRLRRAILAAAYEDPIALARMMEAADDNTRALSAALLASAPIASRAKGRLPADQAAYDISGHIAAAANEIAGIRAAGGTVEGALAQMPLFGDPRPAVQAALMRLFEQHKRSGRRITAMLEGYWSAVEVNIGVSLTGDARPTADALLEAAAKAAGDGGYGGTLFDSETRPEDANGPADLQTRPGVGDAPDARGAADDRATDVGRPAAAMDAGGGGADAGAMDARRRQPNQQPAPRVAVAPLPWDQTPRKLKDVMARLQRLLRRTVRRTQTHRRNVLGTYYPGSANIRLQQAGDLSTAAHELAHWLDDQYGPLWREWHEAELNEYAAYGSRGDGSLEYRMGEGVAEFVRAWMLDPDEVGRRSGAYGSDSYLAHLQRVLPQAVQDAIQSAGREVRMLAGMPAEQRVLANVNTEPTPKSPLDVFRTSGEEHESFRISYKDRMIARYVDMLWPVVKAAQTAKGLTGVDPRPSQDIEVLMRLWHGFNARWPLIMDKGPVNAELEHVLPGGVEWLLEPLDKSSHEAMKADRESVSAYLLAWRVSEKAANIYSRMWELINQRVAVNDPRRRSIVRRAMRMARRRAAQLGGWSAGLGNDQADATRVLQDLQQDPEKAARVFEAAKRYRQWADAILDYMVARGAVSQESARQMRADNRFYADMHRDLSDEQNVLLAHPDLKSVLGRPGSRIHQFKGSTRTLNDPYANLLSNTFRLTREADRNHALASLVRLLEVQRGMHQGSPVELADIGRRVQQGAPDAITVWANGKAEYWQFEPHVHAALMAWGELLDSNVLTMLADLARAGTTAHPAFRILNIMRDAVMRSVLSRIGTKPWQISRGSDAERDQMAMAGAGMAGHYMTDPDEYLRLLDEKLRDMSGDGTLVLLPRKVMRWWSRLGEAGENVNRVPEYRAAYRWAKARGYSDYDARLLAAVEARTLLDFQRGGSFTRKVNRYVPFANAAVQGLARLYQAARENPRRFFLNWMVYVLTPSLLLKALNEMMGTDDDLRQQPAYLRDMFWLVPLKRNLWLTIPRPWELGVMASGVERAIDAAQGDPDPFRGWTGSLLKAVAPVDESAIAGGPLRSVVEAGSNYDWFRGRAIVPPREERMALEMRDTSRGSRLGHWIGQVLDVDPRKVDHVLGGQLGRTGTWAANISDLGTGKADPASTIRSWVGLTAPDPGRAAADIDEALTLADRYNLSSQPRVRQIGDLLAAAQKAPTEAERARLKERARDVARRVLPQLRKRAEQAKRRAQREQAKPQEAPGAAIAREYRARGG